MAKAFIRLFYDWETKTAALTLEEQGRLIRAMLAYAKGEEPDLPGNEKIIFPVFRDQIDMDNERYEAVVERNRANGAKGGRPPKNPAEPRESDNNPAKPSGLFGNPTKPRKAKNEDMNNKYILPPKSPTGGGRSNTFFDQFWAEYPRKASKQAALKAWNKIDPDEALARQIVQAVERFRRDPSWLQDNGRYIPYPATFLNGRRWEDEPPEGQQPDAMPITECGGGEHAELDHLYD